MPTVIDKDTAKKICDLMVATRPRAIHIHLHGADFKVQLEDDGEEEILLFIESMTPSQKDSDLTYWLNRIKDSPKDMTDIVADLGIFHDIHNEVSKHPTFTLMESAMRELDHYWKAEGYEDFCEIMNIYTYENPDIKSFDKIWDNVSRRYQSKMQALFGGPV